MYTIAREVVPFFAVCGQMWEIAKPDGSRLCIVAGPREQAQAAVDALNGGPEATYSVVRYFAKGGNETLHTCLSLEDAKAHCEDPETSSRTCTSREGLALAAQRGPWFDGYVKED